MNRQDVETGIKRLYYVAWACWVVGGIGMGIDSAYRDFMDYNSGPRAIDIAIWIGVCVVAPPAIMFAVRWIYRGFIPIAKTGA